MLSLVVTHDIYDVGQLIADLGESDKSQEWVQAGERPEMEKWLRKPKGLS